MLDSFETSFDHLMAEWKAAHRQRGFKTFIYDGAVNYERYENTSPRICFFLKEAYSQENSSDWNLTQRLSEGFMTRMWGNVAEWTYGIINTTITALPQKQHLSAKQKAELLQKIAVVNIKKSDGKKQSNYEDLLACTVADQLFLQQELQILNPDVIVCGYNSSLLRFLYGADLQEDGTISGDSGQIPYHFMREKGFTVVGGQIILDFYHPANHFPSIMNYYTICSLYQQALKLKSENRPSSPGQQNTTSTM